jgi:hypothetical protein
MPSRQGSDIDGSKLKSLFAQLGFDVIFRRNLIYTVGLKKNLFSSFHSRLSSI